jgi:hypothetical protein
MNLETQGIIFSSKELDIMGLPERNPFPYAQAQEFYHLAAELYAAHTELGNYEEVEVLRGVVGVLRTIVLPDARANNLDDCWETPPTCPQQSSNTFASRQAVRRHNILF